MDINFTELKKQELNYKAVVAILEAMYNEFNATSLSTLILNEYVDDLNKVDGKLDEFTFELEQSPISASDILIVPEDGSFVITPSSITDIDGKIITIKSTLVNSETTLFVTYKF